jgi:hypothetical protein
MAWRAGAVTRGELKDEKYDESRLLALLRLAKAQKRENDENHDNHADNVDDTVHDSLQWRLGSAFFSNVPSTLILCRQRGANRKGSG